LAPSVISRDAAVGEQVLHVLKPQADDVRELGFAERAEEHDVVDAIEELGAEVLFEDVGDFFARELPAVFVFERFAREQVRAEVRGHDEDGVLEVDGAAFGVGEAAIVENLQEDIKDVGVCFFDLVEEHDSVGAAANGLGELAAFVEADVAGGRADEACYGVLLHVLGHIDTDHGLFVVEEELGEGAGGLGLADAGGS
jgi:hypothetical protein